MPRTDSLSDAGGGAGSRPVRVCIVQEIVPLYRVPVFDMLARQPGIALEIWSHHAPQGSLKPAKGTGAYVERDEPWRKFGPFILQKGQVAAARSGRFDVIIYPWNARMLSLFRALRIARRHGVGTVVWGHGYSKSESSWRRRLRNRLAHKADACLLYTRTGAKRLELEGFDPARLFAAQNSIDQRPIIQAREDWRSRPHDLERFRAKHGIIDHALAIFISRLEPDKRVDVLLEAFAKVVRELPSARLALIGKGSAENSLREQARRLNLESHVIFAGAIYDDANLAPWFLSAGCMAYPAAIGLSIFHAFGYGLPVVTSDDIPSHNPEIEALCDGENGLLYRDGDANDFAAKMLICMRDRTTRQRMGEQALAAVRAPDGYCIERMVRGFTDAIAFAQNQALKRR